MLEYALGMVETRGLVAAIEAADVMVKTANVRILGSEYVRNGLVTIHVIGEVAAVKAAVEAGRASAARIGQVVSTHVIPRPADDIEEILKKLPPFIPQQPRAGQPTPSPQEPVAPRAAEPVTPASEDLFSSGADKPAYRKELEAMTVHQLRTLARNIGGLGIVGRQISKANKDLLIAELMRKRTNA